MLPENQQDIHGRTEEIDNIVEALTNKSGKVGVFVSGPAGVGKSTVAIQAGHRLKNEFGTIVKFCSLEGAYKRDDREDDGLWRKILNVCFPGHQHGSQYPKYVLLKWCKQLECELVLIVDNAEFDDHGNCFLLNLLSEMRMNSPEDYKLKFLVTSRRLDIEKAEAFSHIQFDKIRLGPLNVTESIEILRNSGGLTSDNEPDTEAKLLEIATLCEKIPLALRLIGPLLAKESEYTFEELKQKLEQNAAKALGVEDIMGLAFEKLDHSLKRTLVSLSVFSQSFNKEAAKAILGDDCAEDLTKLIKRCLIQKQGDRYLIHLLIRSYAKQVGAEKEKFHQILFDAKQRFLRHFLSLILKNVKLYWGKNTCKKSYSLFDKERLYLESTLRKIAGQKEIENCGELEALLNECQQVAPYIEHCVHFKLYDEFLTGLRRLSHSQKKITKKVEILCLLYHEKRKYSWKDGKACILNAKELYDSNISHFERERLSKAFFLNHYGRYLSQEGNEREKAQGPLKEAISIYKEEKDRLDSTFDIGRILSRQGRNYAKLQDRQKEALASLKEALSFRLSHYGNHFLTAFAHKDLADYYFKIKDFGKADESYQEAIQVLEDIEMTEQKEVISVYKNFGRCCEMRGDIEQAREKLEKGRDVANNTIEGSVRVKVKVNTHLALLLYKHYNPDELCTADKISKDVFDMSEELKMDEWCESKELAEFYHRKQT